VSLSDWLKNGWLTQHRTSREEIADLLGVIERDLGDCQTAGLSPDWRLTIAYNAGLQVATTALAASGYRASREAQHYRAIQSLAFTLQVDAAGLIQLEAFRKKRNVSDYERAGAVSQVEADEMVALAQRLRDVLVRWLEEKHPGLLPAE